MATERALLSSRRWKLLSRVVLSVSRSASFAYPRVRRSFQHMQRIPVLSSLPLDSHFRGSLAMCNSLGFPAFPAVLAASSILVDFQFARKSPLVLRLAHPGVETISDVRASPPVGQMAHFWWKPCHLVAVSRHLGVFELTTLRHFWDDMRSLRRCQGSTTTSSASSGTTVACSPSPGVEETVLTPPDRPLPGMFTESAGLSFSSSSTCSMPRLWLPHLGLWVNFPQRHLVLSRSL